MFRPLRHHFETVLASVVATFIVLMLYSTSTLISMSTTSEIDFVEQVDVSSNKNVLHSNLLNMTNFRYLMNPACETGQNDSRMEVIVLVTSNAKNFQLRQAHRNSFDQKWLFERLGIRRFFLLAQDPNREVSRKLRNEFLRHRDLVQGNFAEAYTMLSYKHIMGLQWVTHHCKTDNQKRLLIVKMDDDIIVDFVQLVQKLKTFPDSDFDRKLFGFKHYELPVKRFGKWAVGKNGFGSSDVYPDFLSGWAYICSTTTAKLLVDAAMRSNDIFWIDDVWVTGFLARNAGIEIQPLNAYYTVYVEHLKCCVAEKDLICDFIVGPSDGDTKLIEDFAKNVKECSGENVDERLCKRRKFPDSVIKNCPIKNPLFLPDTKVVGEIF